MSLMTGPIVLRTRGFLRKTGVTKIAMKILQVQGYEALLGAAMKHAVKQGWCIWDVGANVGLYSRMFAEWTGPNGSVIAFEPSETTRAMMGAVPSNVVVLPVALAARPGTAMLDRASDNDGANARISDTGNETIVLESGDSIVERNPSFIPDMVKIDVEGHELEVLRGMRTLLSESKLQKLFIEVHFSILGATGRNHVPAEIEHLLRHNGFKTKWTDQSHLYATRVSRPNKLSS